MTDPKDDHQRHYTTTPADDQVGSLDHTDTPQVLPDEAGEVPAQTDKGANHPAVTRDPAAMESRLQGADYAGSDEPDEADPGITDDLAVLGMGNLGINAVPVRSPLADADQNPGYVPPSEDGPREAAGRQADLPEGAPGEAATDRAVANDERAPDWKDRS